MKKFLLLCMFVLSSLLIWANSGRCLYFNGSGNVNLSGTAALKPTTDLAISMWVSMDFPNSGGVGYWISNSGENSSGTMNSGYEVYSDGDGLLHFKVFRTSLVELSFDFTGLKKGAHHFGFVSNQAGTMAIYIDGASVASTTSQAAPIQYLSGVETYLGCDENTYGNPTPAILRNYLSGTYIDEVKVGTALPSLTFRKTNSGANLIFTFNKSGVDACSDTVSGKVPIGAALSNFNLQSTDRVFPFGEVSSSFSITKAFWILQGSSTGEFAGKLAITRSTSIPQANTNMASPRFIIYSSDNAGSSQTTADIPSGEVYTSRFTEIWQVENNFSGNIGFTVNTAGLTSESTIFLLSRTGTSGDFTREGTNGYTGTIGGDITFSNVITAGSSTTTEVKYYTLGIGTLVPSVTSVAASTVTGVTANPSGIITNDAGSTVTEKGICYSTTANPSVISNLGKVTDNGTISSLPYSFTSSLTGLSPHTTYHFRAYATNANGTGYGLDNTFTTDYAAPTTAASNVAVTPASVTSSGFTVTWTPGSGYPDVKTVVFVAAASSGSPTLVDNTTYTGNSSFGAGTLVSSSGSWYCVYNGNGSSATVSNLNPNTTYRIFVASYCGTSLLEKFNQTTTPINQKTDVATNTPASNIHAVSTAGSFILRWTRGGGDKCAVFVKATTSGGSASPENTTTYPANTVFGSDGTQIGATGWYCVYNGTDTTVTLTGLNSSGAVYQFHVVEYIGSAGSENYSTLTNATNPIALSNAVNQSSPTNPTLSSLQANWLGITGVTGYKIDVSLSAAFTTLVVNGQSIAADQTSYVISSLLPRTRYYFRLRAVTAGGESPNSPTYSAVTLPSIVWDGSNWTNGVGPYNSTNLYVVLNANLTATQSFTCSQLLISSGKTLTINPGIYVQTDTLDADGNVVVKSNATGDGQLIVRKLSTGSNSSHTLERYYTLGLHDFAVPVSGINSHALKNDGVKKYNTITSNWTGATWAAPVSFSPTVGYLCQTNAAKTISYTGNVTFSDKTFSLVWPNDGKGFNLLGNPYFSTIKWEDVINSETAWTSTYISDVIWVWNAAQAAYGTYSKLFHTGVGGGTAFIAPGQGFFVKMTNKNASLSIKLPAQVAGYPNSFKSGTDLSSIRLTVTKGSRFDDMVVAFINGAMTDNIDRADAEKMMSKDLNIYSTVEGENIAINGVSENEDKLNIGIYIKANKDTIYSMSYSGDTIINDKPIILEDIVNNVLIPASKMVNYPVAVTSQNDLYFKVKQYDASLYPSIADGSFDENANSGGDPTVSLSTKKMSPFIVASNGGILSFNKPDNTAIVEIHDICGRIVGSTIDNTFDAKLLKGSIVFVTYKSNNQTITKKTIIQ